MSDWMEVTVKVEFNDINYILNKAVYIVVCNSSVYDTITISERHQCE